MLSRNDHKQQHHDTPGFLFATMASETFLFWTARILIGLLLLAGIRSASMPGILRAYEGAGAAVGEISSLDRSLVVESGNRHEHGLGR